MSHNRNSVVPCVYKLRPGERVVVFTQPLLSSEWLGQQLATGLKNCIVDRKRVMYINFFLVESTNGPWRNR